jgi:hypothetical protein
MAFFVRNTTAPVASASELGTSFPSANTQGAAVAAYVAIHPIALGDVLRVVAVDNGAIGYFTQQVSTVPAAVPPLPPSGT